MGKTETKPSKSEMKKLIDEMEKEAHPTGYHRENLKLLHNRYTNTALSKAQLSVSFVIIALTFVLVWSSLFLNQSLWLTWTIENIWVIIPWSITFGSGIIVIYDIGVLKSSVKKRLIYILLLIFLLSVFINIINRMWLLLLIQQFETYVFPVFVVIISLSALLFFHYKRGSQSALDKATLLEHELKIEKTTEKYKHEERWFYWSNKKYWDKKLEKPKTQNKVS